MYWLVLIVSGVLEAVWATALGKSEGFTKLWPTMIFAVALLASMGGLAFAMRELPIGTTYAVWVGIGAALTVAYAMAFGSEPVSWIRRTSVTARRTARARPTPCRASAT